MKHYGNILEIKGAEVPLVDVITGGSPCQDLSVAGKREGLAGERSGLFMEQIRVIKEMRDECARQLRLRGADEPIRPRYMVWENVPGAFSSNKGEDFRCVLEETAKIADENAVIPRLEGKWSQSGLILGDGYSIAWRLHDLQYFGCPQRRKRICLLADFNGHSAGKILFELRRETSDGDTEQTITDTGNESESQVSTISESLSGNIEQSEQARKEVAGDTGTGIAEPNNAYTLKIRGGCERDSNGKSAGKGALVQTEKSGTLGVSQDQTLIQCLNGWDVQSKHIQPQDGIAEALYSGECRGGGGESYVMQTSDGEIAGTLDASYYKGVGFRQGREITIVAQSTYPETTDSLMASGYNKLGTQEAMNGMYVVQGCSWDGKQTSPTLTANNAGGEQRMPDKDNFNAVITHNVVDRPSEPILLESNQNHATVQTDGISTALPASMGMGGGYVPMVTTYAVDQGAGKSSCDVLDDKAPTLATTHYGEPAVCYGLDRASFNQGKNAKYDFSVEEETAQTLVSRGPGGVLARQSEVYVQEITKE